MSPRLLASAALLVALLALPAAAGAADADFSYASNADGTYTVTGCAAACPAAIVIPDTHVGVDVKRIAAGAFIGQTSITSVQTGAHTELIESNAFQGATSLTSVTFSASVREIGDLAFKTTPNLTSVTIPSGVTTVGNQAFAFSGLTSIVVPDSVTTVGPGAFASDLALTSARLPRGLSTIPAQVFEEDAALTTVTLPTAFTTVGAWAFSHAGLRDVTLPATLTTIEYCAFFDMSALTAVRFHGDPPATGAPPSPVCGGGDVSPESPFDLTTDAVLYRASGTTGWGATLFGRPVRAWAPTAPGRPSGVAKARSIVAKVAAGTGGEAATAIAITASPGGRSCTVAGTGGTCTITGLSNGRAYTLTAVARNGGGDSATSARSKPSVPHGAAALRLAVTTKTQGAVVVIAFAAVAPGRAKAVGTLGGAKACTASKAVAKAGTVTLRCALDARTRAALPAKIAVAITFTTADGARFSSTGRVRVTG